MSIDFAAAMRRATTATRALDVAGATRTIREALGIAPAEREPDAAAPAAPSAFAPARPSRRRPADATDAEIVPPRRRRRLGEVIRTLRASARPAGLRPVPTVEIPEGAEFLSRSFTCSAGTRGFRLYVPASARKGARGLIVMLHGCTQSPDDFAAGTAMNSVAERHGLLVAYPGQDSASNARACWNWFQPQDQRRGAGEPAILAGLTEQIAEEFNVPRDRIFVAGLSAGGAMAAVMGEAYPDLFAAVGVHSGLPSGSASDLGSALAAMRGLSVVADARPRPEAAAGPRTIVFHGAADAIVHPSNAARIVAAHAAGPAAVETIEAADGGRRVTRTISRRTDGTPAHELWMIEGAGHAWSGGNPSGSYADPSGPDASAEMVRFFTGAA